MVSLSEYIEKLKTTIPIDDPTFLLSALKAIVETQYNNGSWYNDITITSYIVRALLKMKIEGWNYKATRDFLRMEYQKSRDLYLFSIALVHKKLFREGSLNREIIKIFEHKNLSLSDKAKTIKIDNKTWKILTKEMHFKIIITDEELNIYCDFYWGINPGIWVKCIVMPTFFEMKMSNLLQKVKVETLSLQMDKGYFGTPDLPWLTARSIINLIESGVKPSNLNIQKSIKWLFSVQTNNGNWHSADAPFNSDIEVTAMCVVALIMGGISQEKLVIKNALRYLKDEQLPDGSWSRDPHFSAHVLEALFYGHEEESKVFQRGLYFLRNSTQNWGNTWQPHSIGEILYILARIISGRKIVPPSHITILKEKDDQDYTNKTDVENKIIGHESSIFISSTCYDLKDIRSVLEYFFREKCFSVFASDIASSDFKIIGGKNSIEISLENVARCDLIVLIFDREYGPLIPGYKNMSATHLEYRKAYSLGIPIITFCHNDFIKDHLTWKKMKSTKQPGKVIVTALTYVDNSKKNKVYRFENLFKFFDEVRRASKNSKDNWYDKFENASELNRLVLRRVYEITES